MAPFSRLAFPLALVLVATTASFVRQATGTALSDYYADPSSPPPADAEYLFTQAATNATAQLLNDTDCNLLITFYGAQKYTTWFTDRPNRLAGWMSTRDFVDDFDGIFDGSVPNAVIYAPSLLRSQPADGSVAAQTVDEDIPVSVPVTLCSSEYDPDSDTLSYTARLLSFYPPGIGSPALGNLTLTNVDISALADELVSATLQTPSIYIDGVVAWETEFCFSPDVNITEPVRLTTTIEDSAHWKTNKAIKSKRADAQSNINGQVVQPNQMFCTRLFVDKQHAQLEGKIGATGVWFGITVTGTVTGAVYNRARLGYNGWQRNCQSTFYVQSSACKDPYTGEVIDCPVQGDTIDTSGICAAGKQDKPFSVAGVTYKWTSASCKEANVRAVFGKTLFYLTLVPAVVSVVVGSVTAVATLGDAIFWLDWGMGNPLDGDNVWGSRVRCY